MLDPPILILPLTSILPLKFPLKFPLKLLALMAPVAVILPPSIITLAVALPTNKLLKFPILVIFGWLVLVLSNTPWK